MKLWVLAVACISSVGSAQVVPVASREEPRVYVARFTEGQPVDLQTSSGENMTIILAPRERIASINISNTAVYQAAISEARDSLTLHTSMELYRGAPAGKGTMSIATDQRTYEFQLSSRRGIAAPYVLRFTYGGSDRASARPKPASSSGQYKLSGNKELRPVSVKSDGAKTYIQWSPDQPLPAVFALDRLGNEEMVDGHMREGVLTVDRVHDHLVFRIDDAKAEAELAMRRSRR